MNSHLWKKNLKFNPTCNKCKIPMVKKGRIKEGEKRFKCTKCNKEA